jgi:hypothetical protein
MSRPETAFTQSARGGAAFHDLLPRRNPILGAAPAFFDDFRASRIASLDPVRDEEMRIAEVLSAVEWDLLQHRRLRDAVLRQSIRVEIVRAVLARHRAGHAPNGAATYGDLVAVDRANDGRGTAVDTAEDTALSAARCLAARAVASDPDLRKAALSEITGFGLEPGEIHAAACHGFDTAGKEIDARIAQLEQRRRAVKYAYVRLKGRASVNRKLSPKRKQDLEGGGP